MRVPSLLVVAAVSIKLTSRGTIALLPHAPCRSLSPSHHKNFSHDRKTRRPGSENSLGASNLRASWVDEQVSMRASEFLRLNKATTASSS